MGTANSGTFSFYTQASGGGTPLAIDLTSAGATAILDDGIGQHIVVLAARIDVLDIDDLVTPPVISIGTNSPDYNNILKDYAVTTEENKSHLLMLPCEDLPLLVAVDDVYVNVKVPADATTFSAIVSVGLGSYSLL